LSRITQTTQKFTGKKIEVADENKGTLDVKYKKPDGSFLEEQYTFSMPTLVIGNLVIGERYIEPQGSSFIENITTGDKCECTYKMRGIWASKDKDKYFSSAKIQDKEGKKRYTLQGKYTEGFDLTDVQTGSRGE